LLLLLAADTAWGQSFTINVNYVCTTMTPSGCTAWSQQGTVTEGTQCFPGDSYVLTKAGMKRLDALQMGDMILGYEAATGMDTYSPVRAWLHRILDTPFEFAKLRTQTGELEVSRMHNVATMTQAGAMDFQFAQEIATGSLLKSREGPTELLAIDGTIKQGLFAPLTELSNFYIAANSSSTMFLVHSFAHLRYPTFWDPIFSAIMSVAEYWNPRVHEIDSDNYIHPVARFLQDTFTFAVDKNVRKSEVSKLAGCVAMAS